jgi:hypothetical protein
LVARIVAQNSSLSRSSSLGGIGATVADVPALLTRKSSRPSAAIASCTIRSAAPGCETSPGAAMTAKPCAQLVDRRRAAGVAGQMIERDPDAPACEQLDRRKPDTRCRTGHQRGLAVEIGHVEATRLPVSPLHKKVSPGLGRAKRWHTIGYGVIAAFR